MNNLAAPGGLDKNDLLQRSDVVSRERLPVALNVASFDPSLEGGNEGADMAVNAILHSMLRVKEHRRLLRGTAAKSPIKAFRGGCCCPLLHFFTCKTQSS